MNVEGKMDAPLDFAVTFPSNDSEADDKCMKQRNTTVRFKLGSGQRPFLGRVGRQSKTIKHTRSSCGKSKRCPKMRNREHHKSFKTTTELHEKTEDLSSCRDNDRNNRTIQLKTMHKVDHKRFNVMSEYDQTKFRLPKVKSYEKTRNCQPSSCAGEQKRSNKVYKGSIAVNLSDETNSSGNGLTSHNGDYCDKPNSISTDENLLKTVSAIMITRPTNNQHSQKRGVHYNLSNPRCIRNHSKAPSTRRSEHDDEICHFNNVFAKPYSKHELGRALPRRNFFSCHDKALKEAGLDVDLQAAKAEYPKATNVHRGLDPSVLNARLETEKETHADIKMLKEISAAAMTDRENTPAQKADDRPPETIQALPAHDKTSPGVDMASITPVKEIIAVKTLVDMPTKVNSESANCDFVECKPLSLYLDFVKRNVHEYLQYRNVPRGRERDTLNTNLIKLGQVFELRHQGGIPRQLVDDAVVMAARSVRPCLADPSKICRAHKDREGPGPDGSIRSMRHYQSDDKHHLYKSALSTSAITATKEEEHPKTELERRKLKAEDWSRSVSTNTLTKAKLQSLRELGSDDCELTKWWETFKECRYIRQRHF